MQCCLKNHWCHILCSHTMIPRPEYRTCKSISLLNAADSVWINENPPRGMTVIGAASNTLVKEIKSNGGTAILSLPYRLFINLIIRSDACLLSKSVHTHMRTHTNSILTSTYQLATHCFTGLTEQKFLFDNLTIDNFWQLLKCIK